MTTPRNERRLSEWMEPEVTDQTINRQWLGVRDRMETIRHRRFLGMFAFAALAVSAAALVITRTPAERRPAPTARVSPVEQSAPRAPTEVAFVTEAAGRDVRLEEGSVVSLSAFTGLAGTTSSRDVHLDLARGSALFDVTHVAGRAFVVDAGEVKVRVVGTRFRVTRNDATVSVQVERGRVEVRSPNGVTFVGAGESWPNMTATQAPTRTERVQGGPTPAPQAMEPVPPEEPVSGAEVLFAEANAARRAGRYDAAAQGYTALVEQFPRDGRASLASYELGRMYLDAMREPGRAIAPLRRAIASAPRGASYREDAMARLVSAYSRSHQTEACAQARDRYLAEYASGLHRTAVSRSCTVE